MEVPFQRYGRKRLFADLKNQFYGIRCSSIFRTLVVGLSQSKAFLPRYGRNRSFAGFEPGFRVFAVLFLELQSTFLFNIRSYVQILVKTFIRWHQNLFYGIRCSIFRTLEVILNRSKLLFKNLDKNVYLLGSKPVLWHLPQFYFQNFGGYFQSIRGIVAKIRAKTFIWRLLNWFNGNRYSNFRTFDVIFSRFEVLLPRY